MIKKELSCPIVAEFAAWRVINRRHKLPDACLVPHHPLTGELKLYLYTDRVPTFLETLLRISSISWSIETCA